MKMEVNSKFKINDTIYLYDADRILEFKIIRMDIIIDIRTNDGKERITYVIDHDGYMRTIVEDNLTKIAFRNKEELKNNIINKIKSL